MAAFDRDRDAILLWDQHQGRELYRNRFFSKLSACDPGGALLAAAMIRFAQRWSVASMGRPVPEVDTHHGCYRLSASHLPAGLFGRDEALVVAAQRIDPALPSARQLAAGWGLSFREAEIALALAHGQTDVSIARTLGISPHTDTTPSTFSRSSESTRGRRSECACWRPRMFTVRMLIRDRLGRALRSVGPSVARTVG
jgi:hypothetical protein